MIENEALNNWVSARDGGRRRLATELGVSLGTINNWCSNRPIPPRAENQIRALMMADALPQSHITVPFTAEEFAEIEHAVRADGYTDTTDFARDAIKTRARAINDAKLGIHRLNEEGGGYGGKQKSA